MSAVTTLHKRADVQRGEALLRARTAKRARRLHRKINRFDLPLSLDGKDLTPEQRRALDSFEHFLANPLQCALCGDIFTPRTVGTLACKFHPSEYINRGARLIASAEADPSVSAPSNCGTCTQLNIAPSMRSLMFKERAHMRAGCTSVDHCTGLDILFSKAYFAVPTAYLHLLTAWGHASARIGINSSAQNAKRDILVALASQPNALLVRKAEHLGKTLVIDVPHTSASIGVPVREIYDEMCERFALPKINSMLRDTRLANPIAALSNNSSYAHPDARRRAQLRVLNHQKALITPFVILGRISQSTPGAKRLHLK